jgi:hypothetical protein
LMEMLNKLSIERMKSQMQQILKQFQGSRLDIAIERKNKKGVKCKNLMFNIGSLCQMPISISKCTLRRKKFCAAYHTLKKLPSSLKKKWSVSATSDHNTWLSPSESFDDLIELSKIHSEADEENVEIIVPRPRSESRKTQHSGLTPASEKTSTQQIFSAYGSNSSKQE